MDLWTFQLVTVLTLLTGEIFRNNDFAYLSACLPDNGILHYFHHKWNTFKVSVKSYRIQKDLQ